MFFRSLLFVPGTRTDRIEKAVASEADGVIIDLEDAVELSEKEAVRDRVAGFLEKKQPKKIFVRVNGVETEYFDPDMEKMVLPQVYGLMIPKTEKPEDLRKIDQRITNLEKKKAIPAGQIRLICQIETALGLHKATEIASSTPRVLALAFGAADLTLDLGARLGPEPDRGLPDRLAEDHDHEQHADQEEDGEEEGPAHLAARRAAPSARAGDGFRLGHGATILPPTGVLPSLSCCREAEPSPGHS